MTKKRLSPIHPGEMLREEFMQPMKLTAYRLAKDLGLPSNRITQIINETRAVTPETGLLLARYFEIEDGFFINLQARYDLESARDKMGKIIDNIPSYNTIHGHSTHA